MTRGLAATLPGGWWDNGVPVREAELRPLSVEDEIALGELAGDVPAAAYASEVLARAVATLGARPAGIDTVRGLSAGDREALLLHVRRQAFGEMLSCVLTCPADGCGRPMDLDLRVSDLLLAPYADWQPLYELEHGGQRVRYRVPNGADLEAAAPQAVADAAGAAQALVDRILTDSAHAPEGIGEAIARRLPAIDPQAELRLNLTCAECGAAFSTVLNIAAHLRVELTHRARRIYQEVHALATAYHWSETDILRLSPARRQTYLELIERSV